LPVEIAILALVVAVWQFARVPFEVSLPEAIRNSDRIIDVERALHVAIEPDVIRWLYSRPGLLADANWFYSHMDETIVFGVLAALRLVDPLRFPAVRTAFALAHVPAIVVVALLPSTPPRWTPGIPHAAAPAVDIAGDLRNSTAAAVSLHVGIPVLLAVAAIWMRPRAPLAYATLLLPAVVFAVVVGTANHFVVDAVIGCACAGLGILGARLIHGDPPRGRREAAPLTIAVAGVICAAGALLVNDLVLALS
jgi:hypothetical protein